MRGAKGYWQASLEEALENAQNGVRTDEVEIAGLYAKVGNSDKAFEWLDKAYRVRSTGMMFLSIDPVWDSIRPDPRFADLLRRVGASRITL